MFAILMQVLVVSNKLLRRLYRPQRHQGKLTKEYQESKPKHDVNDVIKSLCNSLTGSCGFTLAKYVVQQEDRLDDATSIFARCRPLSHMMSRSRCIVVPDQHSVQLRACNAGNVQLGQKHHYV